MYDTIVLPTDGSKNCERAEQIALGLAEHFDAEVHALHVIDTRRYSEPVLSTSELETNRAEKRGLAILGGLKNEGEKRGIDVETLACHGVPHEEITRHAKAVDADLIVMGCRGHTHESKIGDVATRVIRNAEPQTLTV